MNLSVFFGLISGGDNLYVGGIKYLILILLLFRERERKRERERESSLQNKVASIELKDHTISQY